MQGSDENKKIGKHAAPPQEPEVVEDVLRADTDLYGDEADVPIRSRKKKAPAPPKAAPKKRRKKKKKSLFARIAAVGKPRLQKRHALFEIVTSDDSSFRGRSVLIYGRRVPFWPLAIAAVFVIITAMIFMSNSNVGVVEENLTIVGLPEDLENYRILVISDLNGKRFGDRQSALLRTINNLSYNAVFFLGDMVGSSGDPEPFYELLEGIPSSKEVFFICGDSDPGPFVDVPRDITGTLSQLVLEDWILGAIERGATYVDSPVCLTVGDSNIWITPSTLMNFEASELVDTWKEQTAQEEDGVISGLEADYQTLPITSYRYRITQNLYNAINSMSENDFYLTLSHQVPSDEYIYAAASHDTGTSKYLTEPELILAGHYCGGVWRLPLVGAFYIPDSMLDRNGWFPAQEDVKGLSTVGETQIYITGGLSTNSDTPVMAFRFLNQPEISLLTLTAKLPESMLAE